MMQTKEQQIAGFLLNTLFGPESKMNIPVTFVDQFKEAKDWLKGVAEGGEVPLRTEQSGET